VANIAGADDNPSSNSKKDQMYKFDPKPEYLKFSI
jgi:hypothetical protein